MYNTTAFLYEKTAAFESPEKTRDEIQQLFSDLGVAPPGVIGDLGAGTGLMGILMAEKGWSVYGVELSQAMIDVANGKRQALPDDVRNRLNWTQGDITDFSPPDRQLLDGAICLCNTINHLCEKSQVESFLHCAHRALKPGGVLILDSDTLDTFQEFFNHPPTVVWDDGKHSMSRSCKFNPESGRANHTARLSRYANGKTKPISEEAMALQYHSEKDLHTAFVNAGFHVKNALPYNPFPKLYNAGFIPKVLWVLQK